MPMTLTLKNILDDIYAKLKSAALQHRRSLNSEVLVCLEAALTPGRLDATERIVRARVACGPAHPGIPPGEIDAFKRAGRADRRR
jgi:plasmid stability protein